MVAKHRRNIHPGRTQTVLQWPRRQTWTRSRVPHSQKHCELRHGLLANFQPTYHHPPEGNAIQHHHHTGVSRNIRLWRWRCRTLLRTTAGSSWPNSKERYPSGARRLERQDRRRCLWELDRHMWKILQHQIKWERPKAPGISQLQQPYAGEHLWPTQSIQKSHVAQPKWKVTQPDRLHHGKEALPVQCEHCQDTELSWSRRWKRPWTRHDDLQVTSEEGQETRPRQDQIWPGEAEVAEAFHAMIGGKFAALTILDADGIDMDTLINTFNTAVTNTASEILGKHRPVKKPWVTADLLDLCDKRRELTKKKKDAEGLRQYRAANQEIKKGMKKEKMNWIEEQCQNIEDSMKKNKSKKTYQLVKGLTSTKQGRTTII